MHAGPRLTALAVIPVYVGVYLGLAYWIGIPEFTRIAAYGSGRLHPRR
jgi:hypothetical protein